MIKDSSDFKKIISNGSVLVSVNILYFLPDQESLLNEFFWQTLDICPQYPRVHRFLNFWKKEIDAKIKEVVISDTPHLVQPKWRNGIVINFN